MWCTIYKNIPNYALGCPLIVECFHPVLGVKVSLCTIFLGRPIASKCKWQYAERSAKYALLECLE